MLEATHRRIAKEVAKVLGLSERETGLLEVGSTQPNEYTCRLSDIPDREIEMEVVESFFETRKFYLENDDEFFYWLGRVLHYIADVWTLPVGDREKQNEWNKKIEECPILDDYQLQEVIKSLTMPSKEIEIYLSRLPVLKELVRYCMFKIPKNNYERILEEEAARELIRRRGYKLIKREEFTVNDRHFSLNVVNLTVNSPEGENIFISCIPTQKIIGWNVLFSLIENKTKIKVKYWQPLSLKDLYNIRTTMNSWIIITGGRFTSDAENVARIVSKALFFTAYDFCIDAYPIPPRLSRWSAPIIDLNFAYRISLEVARLALS